MSCSRQIQSRGFRPPVLEHILYYKGGKVYIQFKHGVGDLTLLQEKYSQVQVRCAWREGGKGGEREREKREREREREKRERE